MNGTWRVPDSLLERKQRVVNYLLFALLSILHTNGQLQRSSSSSRYTP